MECFEVDKRMEIGENMFFECVSICNNSELLIPVVFSNRKQSTSDSGKSSLQGRVATVLYYMSNCQDRFGKFSSITHLSTLHMIAALIFLNWRLAIGAGFRVREQP